MARRGRGAAAAGFVVVLVVAALAAMGLLFGDRYAADRVEREASGQLQSELGTPDAPSVDVRGWPFLTQVVGRHLRSVRVVTDDIPQSSRSAVPVAHADLVLSDITTDDWFQTMTARHAEGTALLDYPALASVAGVPLRYVGDGRVQLKSSSSLVGVPVDATVTGTPRLDAGAQSITLADPEVTVAGVELPGGTADLLLRTLVKPIPVTGLPFGLRLSSVAPEDDGLHVGLQGDGLELSR
jgi:hypothetical protein